MPDQNQAAKNQRPRTVRTKGSVKSYAFTPDHVREIMEENARRHGEAKARHDEAMRKLGGQQ